MYFIYFFTFANISNIHIFINVLWSCFLFKGRVILHELGIEVEKYYACEVDKDALAVSQYHHPDIIHLGDVTNVDIDKVIQVTTSIYMVMLGL